MMTAYCTVMTALALAPVSGSAGDHGKHPPARITIQGPNEGHSQGLTTTTGW